MIVNKSTLPSLLEALLTLKWLHSCYTLRTALITQTELPIVMVATGPVLLQPYECCHKRVLPLLVLRMLISERIVAQHTLSGALLALIARDTGLLLLERNCCSRCSGDFLLLLYGWITLMCHAGSLAMRLLVGASQVPKHLDYKGTDNAPGLTG